MHLRAEEVHKIAAEIAAHLTGWEYTGPKHYDAYPDQFVRWATVRSTGTQLFPLDDGPAPEFGIGLDDPRRRRLSVSPSMQWKDAHGDQWTTRLAHSEDRLRITVSADRPPAKLAKDIESRFLRPYAGVWHRCRAEFDAHNAWLNARDDTEARLRDALEEAAEPPRAVDGFVRRETPIIRLRYSQGQHYVDIQAGEDYARFELRSVPLPLAEKICHLLAAEATGKET